jgi:pimeloyl-ACP methyl ester carboxylesterase
MTTLARTASVRRTRIAAIGAAAAALTLASACSGSTSAAATTAPQLSVSTTTSSTTTASVAPASSTTSPSTTSPATTSPPATTTTTSIAVGRRPTAPVDELVSVGGARLHVRCSGSGDTTVLLVAGLTADHTSFSGIEPEVARATRVCSYDKFGTGTSDPPPQMQTFETQARDIHDALRTLDEAGPFVVVGHSFGGAVAVTFSSLYAEEVGGLLLLEASPPNWNSAACSVADDGSAGAAVWIATCAMQSATGNPELVDGPTAFAQLAQIESLGDVPLVVVTSSDHDYTAEGFDPAAAARVTAMWFEGQEHWASLSTAAQLVSVDGVTHNVHLDRPDLVIGHIGELLARSRCRAGCDV